MLKNWMKSAVVHLILLLFLAMYGNWDVGLLILSDLVGFGCCCGCACGVGIHAA